MKFYYFNSTHWDREWYQPFQQYRKYLVDTTEDLLKCYDEPGFEKFTFDGQTIVLKDICELRPSMRPRLEKVISEGKLNVGPWYVMPDEFLVSLEALIRNLQTGHEVAAEFGGAAWPVGYICDIFGHAAQTPQIFAGFGLLGAVGWRGYPNDCGPTAYWQSPDGTTLPLARLYPYNGYGNFSLDVRGWWDVSLDEGAFKARFSQWIDETRWHFGDTFILSDAIDHAEAEKDAGKMLQWVKELYPDAEVYFSDYRDFFANEFVEGKEHSVLKGEQLTCCHDLKRSTWQISSTLSSRYDVKHANDCAEARMELTVEPASAYRAIMGLTPQSIESLRYIWRTIIQNHAHDSICGCSIDQVHREVLSRFGEVSSLADVLEEESVLLDRQALTGRTMHEDTLALERDADEYALKEVDPDGSYTVRFFHPLPGTHRETRRFTLDFPTKQPYPKTFGYALPDFERINSFKLYNENNEEIPYTIVFLKKNQNVRFHRHDCRRKDRYTVVAHLTLRGAGWTTVKVRVSDTPAVRYRASMLVGRQSADNGILRLDVSGDGTFNVTDKRTGRVYERMNQYFITREIGDGWWSAPTVNGAATLDSSRATVRLLVNGPAQTAFEMTRYYTVPKEVIREGGVDEQYVGAFESSEMAELAVRTIVALNQGSDQLEMHTEIDNNVKDYRLRLEVPTGIPGGYFVNQFGAIIQREAGRISGLDGDGYGETERVGRNFDGFIGKRDAQGGVALLQRTGMHEGGVTAENDTTFFVTLLRAFRKTVGLNGEVDGQLLKHLEWDYQLKFFQADTSYAELYTAMQNASARVLSYMVPEYRVIKPLDTSVLSLEGGLALSAMKIPADGEGNAVVIRFVNPSGETQSETICFIKAFKSAALCRLDETLEEVVAENSDSLTVTAEAWKYTTVKVRF